MLRRLCRLRWSVLVVLPLLGLPACKDEDFENAKVHHCNLQRLMREVQARPGDPALMRQIEESRTFLETVVQGAANPADVRAKLGATTCP